MDIHTNGHISNLGKPTGYAVSQDAQGTRLYRVKDGQTVPLPCARYALSCNAPASGIPGRAQFEDDALFAMLND